MIRKNLHPVEEGRVYRSGRLEPADFEKAVRDLGIKTLLRVICLSRHNRDYFKAIGEICERLGVEVHGVSLQHNHVPDKSRIRMILDVFERCSYPLLIMCHRGADRSGLTCAMYKMTQKRPRKEVESQLRLYPYGHVAMLHPKFHYFLKELYTGFDGDLYKYMESDKEIAP